MSRASAEQATCSLTLFTSICVYVFLAFAFPSLSPLCVFNPTWLVSAFSMALTSFYLNSTFADVSDHLLRLRFSHAHRRNSTHIRWVLPATCDTRGRWRPCHLTASRGLNFLACPVAQLDFLGFPLFSFVSLAYSQLPIFWCYLFSRHFIFCVTVLFFTQLSIPNYPLPRVTFSLKVPLLLARLQSSLSMEYVLFFLIWRQDAPKITLSTKFWWLKIISDLKLSMIILRPITHKSKQVCSTYR